MGTVKKCKHLLARSFYLECEIPWDQGRLWPVWPNVPVEHVGWRAVAEARTSRGVEPTGKRVIVIAGSRDIGRSIAPGFAGVGTTF